MKMALFETVRDQQFAENIEHSLSSIYNELKKANLLKERELELIDKELQLKNNNISEALYKKAFHDACARLADLDKLIYKIDNSIEPCSKEKYQDIILSSIYNLDKSDSYNHSSVVKEISEGEFEQFINSIDSNKLEYEKQSELICQKFGSSFMFYDSKNKMYICYDYLQGENGLPNIEEINDKHLASKWLKRQVEIDEISIKYGLTVIN